MAPAEPIPATPTGPVIALTTADAVSSPPPRIPPPPAPSTAPVSYYSDNDSTPSSSLTVATPTGRLRDSSLSPAGARALGAALGTVVGLGLLIICFLTIYLCCRRRARAAAAGAGVYRNSSFCAGPSYANFGPMPGIDSAATSKEAFAQYQARRSSGTAEMQMSELDLAHAMPRRPESAITYDPTVPGTPVSHAPSERIGPVDWKVKVEQRDVKAVKAGTPVKAIVAPVLTTSLEAIRQPPVAYRPNQPPAEQQRRAQESRQPSPPKQTITSPASAGSSLRSPSTTNSTSSSPETRLSHTSVPTPPTSPLFGPDARKSAQGERPKLRIITAIVGDGESEVQVPQVAIEPLRLPAATRPKKPDYARLLFAAGVAAGGSSTSLVTTATTTGAVEDFFAPASSPKHAEPEPEHKHPPARQRSVPPPAIVITSPQVEWEGEELSPTLEGEYEDEGYGSDEQDQGDYSNRDEDDIGDIDDEDVSGGYSPTHVQITLSRAIAVDLHLPMHMSPTIPGLPSGFPSSVSFKSSASNASMHTASPTQGLPMQFASRRELTSPTGFPQSPCESEADFDSDCERETGATDACSFSPVLGHPTTQHSPVAKANATFRILELDQGGSPLPKRPQTAEERLKGLGIGSVRLPTITVTEWAEEEGLMRL